MSRKSFSTPSDQDRDQKTLEKLIGLGPRSMQKSYYPELKARLDELTRFRTLLDNTNDLIILISVTSGKIIDANKTTESLFGLESSRIVGQPLNSFMDQREADIIYAFFRQKDSCSRIIQSRFLTPDNRTIPVEINCKHVRMKPNGYGVLIARNVTDQEKARHEIELQRAFYRQLFDNSPKAMVLSDEKFQVADINKAFTSLFGYRSRDLAGKNINKLIIPREQKHEKHEIEHQVQDGRPVNFETRRITRTGQILDMEVLCVPVTFAGKFNGFFSIFSDLTEKLRMERDLARQQKLESIALLAGGIAHDFNNILAIILANTSLGKTQSSDNPQIKENLNKIENASLRAKDLTRQLITFAKGGQPVKDSFDLKKLLRDTVNFAMSGSASRVVFDIDQNLKPVFADQGQISQVIQNLTINADQAMPDNGLLRIAARNIVLDEYNESALPPGDYVLVKFTDNGTGIRPEDINRIFDPYFTTKEHGSGLGLAVTHSIIKKHGASIKVQSSPGQGTEFTIVLQTSDKPPKQESAETRHKPVSARVLLMDDEPDILEVTAEYLETIGYSVEVARNGNEALSLYLAAWNQHQPFDIVVSDLTVPGGMGGKELIHELKKTNPDLKAIVSSGYADDPVISEHKAHGFSAMIVKPYSIEELDRLIQKCLQK
ncbi:MAG: PAS domain S-box protein [Desulfonatronovibrio sp.]